MHFSQRLHESITNKKSPICLGLDPHFDLIPEKIKKEGSPGKVISSFLTKILRATHDLVACCKPNYAFFEQFGSEGIRALEKVAAAAQKLSLPVIVDGKRNDIGSTAAASARGFLANDLYDALTINPYLGEDGLLPFIELAKTQEKGVFILVKTSNPSSGQIQDLICGEKMLYEEVAHLVARLGSKDLDSTTNFSSVGAVVGATYPEEIRLLRQEMPGQILLIPGYGAQGGGKENVLPAFYQGGKGAIINSSRGILFAKKSAADFELNAREAALNAQADFASIFET
jgi:orotidine-5'-phosphate decarboxylase